MKTKSLASFTMKNLVKCLTEFLSWQAGQAQAGQHQKTDLIQGSYIL
jgi:hypothetical protein